ncbi:hypothetical protein RDWZM_007068 [Blomia tropicalis]|uniref:Uncharacterized protein n=1 Tax=Blomia tropicalis TaxID=40697 RepID=A0A9Q0RP03_BLOTA|nr:hypothetical protein RDWZM_007068 [Blomia tropicalis]
MTTSTLVETVSINYEDFTEGFLTCGTCLYTYDGDEHTPKLLPCSHTICRICLERISAAAATRDPSGNFRCPICRESIQLPRGGVMGLPPSFLVNQLLDLMTSQRREVVPKCSSHVSQELLYCESCDLVFCSQCTSGKHGNLIMDNGITCEHTVIPFSIAIKRMSEILLYKGQQCISKLNESAQNVLNEMQKLDQNSELAFEDINRTFQEIINIVDKRRQELLNHAKKIREDKRSVLREQLSSIEMEKTKLESDCSGFKYQVEVRNISKKINDLKEKLDSINMMSDPKENCFLRFEHLHNSAIDNIQECVDNFGSIRTSNTFPSLCIATIGRCSAHLRSLASVVTYDYNGQRQKFGGDPLIVLLQHEETEQLIPCKIIDNRDGTYDIQFVPTRSGTYSLKVTIFGRQIKNYPLEFEVTDHINPLCIYGCKGADQHQFLQPTSLAIDDDDGYVFVLDTGNGRIKKLLQNQCNNSPFRFIDHIERNGLENRSATGIAHCKQSHTLLVTNWRHRDVKQFTCDGKFVQRFVHNELHEPTCIAVSPITGNFMVADNSTNSVLVFTAEGKLSFKITNRKQSITSTGTLSRSMSNNNSVISGICFHPSNGDMIVADTRIMIYSADGRFNRELFSDTNRKGGGGYFSGVTIDNNGKLLATKVDKSRCVIQVIDYDTGQLKFSIDSNDAKLKRPSCLATTNDDHVIIVDLGNDCIKKYRYW